MWISYRTVEAKLCEFMISFPATLSPCRLSLLAAGWKWAGREEGMAQKLLPKPQPLFEWGCVLVHYSAFSPVFQAKKRDVEMHSCLLSYPPFFFSSPLWPCCLRVNTSLILTKTSGISHFWFCLCLGLDIPLCAPVSLHSHLLYFYTSLLSPSNTVHVSPSLHWTQCLYPVHWNLVLNAAVSCTICIKNDHSICIREACLRITVWFKHMPRVKRDFLMAG